MHLEEVLGWVHREHENWCQLGASGRGEVARLVVMERLISCALAISLRPGEHDLDPHDRDRFRSQAFHTMYDLGWYAKIAPVSVTRSLLQRADPEHWSKKWM